MRQKDVQNDQSGVGTLSTEHRRILGAAYMALREHARALGYVLGLESGSATSGSSGSGSQDSLKSLSPEHELARMKEEIAEARRRAKLLGIV
jgi:hypothetical protein